MSNAHDKGEFFMKHIFIAALVAVFLGFGLAVDTARAQSEKGSYSSITGAWVSPSDPDIELQDDAIFRYKGAEMGNGFALLAAFGYGGQTGERFEVELGYRTVDVERGTDSDVLPDIDYAADVTTWSLMGNTLYVFEMAGKANPYVGAGLGFARHEFTQKKQTIGLLQFSELSQKDTVFAYQAMVGLHVPVSETADVKIGYRYFATADMEFDNRWDSKNASYGTHNFETGVIFRF